MPADYDFITDRLAIGDVASRSTDGFCAVVSLLSSSPFDEQYKAPPVPEGVPVMLIDQRDGGDGLHSTVFEPVLLSVSYDNGQTWTEPKYCGSTHCDGGCGHPALVFTDSTGRVLRAHGSQVACGLVFQMQRSGRQAQIIGQSAVAKGMALLIREFRKS